MTMDYNAPGPNRERVRALMAAGLTTREIANTLGLSTQRVNRIKAILAAIEADEKEHAS